jgi:hypothetical protein
MAPGSKIYGSAVNSRSVNPDFRCLGVVNASGTGGGFVAINRGTTTISKKFVLSPAIQGANKLYFYSFGEGLIRLGEDGFVKPNEIIEGSLNKWLSVSLPANSFLVVSTEAL